MAESVFARVRRLLSARIEDSVDAMECANSDGTMREAIREVSRAIDEVRSDQEKAMTRRLQAARQQEMIAKKVDELTAKARFALQEGREDLAEGALKRQVDLEEQAGGLDQVQSLAREEEARLEESLSALRARKKQMEEALAAFAIARTEASLGGDGHAATRTVERQVENAEAAFDRAMTGAGGIGFTRGDAEAINQVAEIDTLAKKATVAERLAALKLSASQAA
ncbi:MAG: PspA/IM30 family protein [Novosphingobium sp.]|uniref:PspA/IM30 family protein n=1 Tax=Novosphingobium sp. TaxID=1874826 RepID=UPI002735AD56|nr:PspA/IM30 family protein [Novosphingobium sp.]MDP3550809.1 PspA/IM30 family protein [Novosphingobium sp.]